MDSEEEKYFSTPKWSSFRKVLENLLAFDNRGGDVNQKLNFLAPGQRKRICSKSNFLCNEKEICPDATYDGQSSKDLYTRSLGHSYKYEKNHKDSFLQLHQDKSHNGEDENFKLSVTRFYGKDRLACEIAEAVILRSRKGDVCNLKSEWHDPPLIQVRRQVQRDRREPEAIVTFLNPRGF